MGELSLKNSRLEGHLYKYTNVVKGFQIRYFVVNTNTSKLDYFMTEDAKLQRPRGSIELLNSIISPSDEDSTTFLINTPENEIYKIRAQDAKERQHWVNVLRLASQSINETELRSYSDKLDKSDNESQTKSSFTDPLHETFQKILKPKITNKEFIEEVFKQVKKRHDQFQSIITQLPVRDAQTCRYNKDILDLKATASACVNNILSCCAYLHSNQVVNNRSRLENYSNFEFKAKPTVNPNFIKTENTYSTRICEQQKLELKDPINHEDEITDDESSYNSTNNDKTEQNLKLFEDNKHLILKLLPNLKNGTELDKVPFPTFLHEPKSLLELFADSMSHPDLLLKISEEKNPEERIIKVLEWYLSSFNQIRKDSIAKKPFNPILGETFNCSWKLNNTDYVTYEAEQVSHHPAVSAFYVETKDKKIKLNASIMTKSKYLGMSISIQFLGGLILKLENFNEEYLITLPNLFARSIVTKPWIELGNTSSIFCPQTGLKAIIDFQVQSFYEEATNQIFSQVKNKSDELICRVKGEWNAKLEFEFLNEKSNSKILDMASLGPLKKKVRPVEKQLATESRKVWYSVAQALKNSDSNLASILKSSVEKQQRICEKLRHDKNLEFTAKHFYKTKLGNEKQNFFNGKSDDTDLNEYWLHNSWNF